MYFGAGIWPSEGIFLYAVDAATGKPVWCNDSSGGMEMDQPHPTARAVSGAAAKGTWSSPATPARAHGPGRAGGVRTAPTGSSAISICRPIAAPAVRKSTAFDQFFVNGGTLFAAADGTLQHVLGTQSKGPSGRIAHGYTAGVQVAVHPQWVVCAKDGALLALDRQRLVVDREVVDRKGARQTDQGPGGTGLDRGVARRTGASLIVAGDAVMAGGEDRVTAWDIATGEMRWQAGVRGRSTAWRLRTGGCCVSTDRGRIYCFGSGEAPPVGTRSRAARCRERRIGVCQGRGRDRRSAAA